MDDKKAIVAGKIFISGKFVCDQAVIIRNDKIVDIVAQTKIPPGMAIEEFPENSLVPGFIDIQVNGGGGVLFNDDPSAHTIKKIGEAHRKFGTTGFLPTLISDDLDKVAAAIAAVDEAIGMGVPGVLGIHIEGPFLNEQKKGIHNSDKFRRLEEQDIELLSSLKRGKTLITIAPEMNDPELIRKLVTSGVTVAAGHTNASYEQAMLGVDAGISGFTHLYNAMSAFESRRPGVVGAAFAATDTWASLIADGHHVHPAALKHAVRAKGIDKTILITDAMPTVGSQIKEFRLADEVISLKDGRCTNADGVLAGSNLDMAAAVRYMVGKVGTSFEEAILMATLSPATFMKLEHETGSIAVRNKASFVLLDEKMDVLKTWVDGDEF